MSKLASQLEFTAHARGKVNLALEIFRKRRDGYHEIETILQSIDLFDTLEIAFNTDRTIRLTCSDPDIPTDSSNLCYRAVELMRPLVHPDLGAVVHLEKRIPHGAGLGGGSSDAAAILLTAAKVSTAPISMASLEEVARKIGSDVPFMLYGGTVLGTGRGEELTRLHSLSGGFFLIVKPSVNISTASVYKNVNLALTRHRYRINLKAVNALLARFPGVRLSFRNALEDVVCPAYPQVASFLGELQASKPLFAAMSGSGSALFAIYETEAQAVKLADEFSVRGFFATVVIPSTRAVDIHRSEPR